MAPYVRHVASGFCQNCHFESFLLKGVSSRHLLFKVSKGNTKSISEICAKLTIKTPEWCQWRCCTVFIVNFEHISHIVLVFPLVTMKKCMPVGFVRKYEDRKNEEMKFLVDWWITIKHKLHQINWKCCYCGYTWRWSD